MKNDVNLDLITSYMANNDLTSVDFCKKCNISPQDLELIFTGSLDFDLIILFKIARLLSLETHELFNK